MGVGMVLTLVGPIVLQTGTGLIVAVAQPPSLGAAIHRR